MIRPLAVLLSLAHCALGALAGGCCCPIELDLAPLNPEERERRDDDDDDVRERADEVDIGTAEHPDENGADLANHPWHARAVDPPRYRLGYKLADDSARGVLGDYHRFAREVGHRQIDENRFQWRPATRCLGGLHCIYETLDDQSREGVVPIAKLFEARAAAADLDLGEAAALVISFVQHIRYEIPKEQPFGVLPPALVVKEKRGDCDSKSLLAHMLLRELGVRSVLVSSNAHAHTMLAVALPAPGKSFTWRGTEYAFVEVTAKHAPIGHMDPKLLRPNDWQVVEMRYSEASRGSAGAGRTAIEAVRGGPVEIE